MEKMKTITLKNATLSSDFSNRRKSFIRVESRNSQKRNTFFKLFDYPVLDFYNIKGGERGGRERRRGAGEEWTEATGDIVLGPRLPNGTYVILHYPRTNFLSILNLRRG